MTRRGCILVIGAALQAVACGAGADGPPAIEVDRSSCAHCGMLISERVYAAAYTVPGSQPGAFDDIRCLLQAVAREPDPGAARYWFHDAQTATWIGGDEAVFVASPDLRTPMGGGLVAYRDRAAARAAAARLSGARLIDTLEDLRRTSQ